MVECGRGCAERAVLAMERLSAFALERLRRYGPSRRLDFSLSRAELAAAAVRVILSSAGPCCPACNGRGAVSMPDDLRVSGSRLVRVAVLQPVLTVRLN